MVEILRVSMLAILRLLVNTDSFSSDPPFYCAEHQDRLVFQKDAILPRAVIKGRWVEATMDGPFEKPLPVQEAYRVADTSTCINFAGQEVCVF